MIRVALVGAGVMGALHGRSVNSFGDTARVTQVFDRDPALAAAVAHELGAEVASSSEQVVASADVDAVVIAIPPRFHRATVELALEHGRRVFLEKPIAVDRDDALAIVDAVRRTGGSLMVGHVLRFWPGYPELHAIATGGTLGDPISVVCARLQPPPSATGWLADVEQTGGIAPLVMVHDFDLMNWLLGTPRTVSSFVLQGEGAAASHVVSAVTYDSGRGVVEASVSLPRTHPFSTSISVQCERGSVHFGFDVEPAPADAPRDAGRFTPVAPPVLRVCPDDGSPGTSTEITSHDPWRPEMAYFLDRAANDLPVEHGTPEQALAALELALAATESFTTGAPVVV